MSSTDATIDVVIDKTQLVNAIAQDVCNQCQTGGSNPAIYRPIAVYNINNAAGGVFKAEYEGGWFKFDFIQGYTKPQTIPPFIPFNLLDNQQAIVIGALFYIVDPLQDSYVLFNEPAPTFANDVLGFHASQSTTSDGVISVDPASATPTGTTSMDVNVGDIVALGWKVARYSNTLYMMFGGGKIDYATGNYTHIIDAYITVPSTYTRNFRYVVLWEPNNTSMRLAIGPYVLLWGVQNVAPSGGITPIVANTNVFQFFKDNGLQDPATLDWTFAQGGGVQ